MSAACCVLTNKANSPTRVHFIRHLDSLGDLTKSDIVQFQRLPGGDDLETGSIPRADAPGAPVTAFEELWRDIEPPAGPESASGLPPAAKQRSLPQAWILESLHDGDCDSAEIEVTKTFLGRIQGTFLALRQEQTTKRITHDDGSMTIVRSGGEVSARRDEWVSEQSRWLAKYVIGAQGQQLPSPAEQDGGVFVGEASGAWQRVGDVVSVLGQKYVVRAFEEAVE